MKTDGTRPVYGVFIANVLPPMTRLEDPRLTDVPGIVTAEPSSNTTVPAKLKPVGLAVKA